MQLFPGVFWNLCDDINDAVGIWNDLFVDAANRHGPLKKIGMKSSSKSWILNDLRKLMAERDYAKKVTKKIRHEGTMG